MEKFVKPEVEIINFTSDDIVRTSCTGDSVICEEDWCYKLTGQVDAW